MMNVPATLAAIAAGGEMPGLAACQASEPARQYDGRNLYLDYCASCQLRP